MSSYLPLKIAKKAGVKFQQGGGAVAHAMKKVKGNNLREQGGKEFRTDRQRLEKRPRVREWGNKLLLKLCVGGEETGQ